MRIGNADLYGWDRPQTVRLRGVLATEEGSNAYAVLQVLKSGVDPVHLLVTPRVGGRWITPDPGERVEVLAWTLKLEGADGLVRAIDAGQRIVDAPCWGSPTVLWLERGQRRLHRLDR